MKRLDLEHILRAAREITQEKDFVIIGSQAILGSYEKPPAALLVSEEADIYPLKKPELADLIEGAIGEGSQFYDTFGYYAHAVGPATASAPKGWQKRLVKFRNKNTSGAIGWCLEPHDLVLAKCVRGELKDYRYLEVALQAKLVKFSILLERLPILPADPIVIANIEGKIRQVARKADLENGL